MRNLLIICYGFGFEKSTNANAHCLNAILQNRYDKGNVVVFTDGDRDETQTYNNIVVRRFDTSKNRSAKSKINLFSVNCLKALKIEFSPYYFSTLMTISFPFQIAKLGLVIKKYYPDIMLVSYFLDPYAANRALRFQKLLYPFRAYLEKKVINKSQYVIIAKDLTIHYSDWGLDFRNKILPLPIPLLEIKKNEDRRNVPDRLKMVYAGALSKLYRDPNPLLYTLLEIYKHHNVNFEVYFFTANDDVVDLNVLKEFRGALRVQPLISKRDLEEQLATADVLINLGNKGLKGSLPSKLIEYIGYKKGILNAYVDIDDISADFLKAYPNHFNFKVSTDDVDIIPNLVHFLLRQKGELVDDSDIELGYSEFLTKNISDKLYSLF